MIPRAGWGGAGVANANLSAKAMIRQWVADRIDSPAVLECFAGDGALTAAWESTGASVVGIDAKPWKQGLPERYVADVHRAMASLDLARFNVFDVDAWGSPFPVIEQIGRRRRWSPGERGAVVWTDGSTVHTMKRGRSSGLKKNLAPSVLAASYGTVADDARVLNTAAAIANIKVMDVQILDTRVVHYRGAGSGLFMIYGAAVFEGHPTSAS